MAKSPPKMSHELQAHLAGHVVILMNAKIITRDQADDAMIWLERSSEPAPTETTLAQEPEN